VQKLLKESQADTVEGTNHVNRASTI